MNFWSRFEKMDTPLDEYIMKNLGSSKVGQILAKELDRQEKTVELIPSENYPSVAVRLALASAFGQKYAEGYPTKRTSGMTGRYYGGCGPTNELEEYCCDMWRKVFHTDYHVNVQPHSGSQANYAAYASILDLGDTVLSMSLNDGA